MNVNARVSAVWATLCVLTVAPATAQPPASYPHDMSNYGCIHYDEKTCDQAPAPPPDYNPLVGTWVRFSLLRNGFSVQPPDAPLYVKFNADGHWLMMEFPANRPKVNKPLDQQSPQELFTRFDKLEGSWGPYSQDGMLNLRHHRAGLGPGGGGESTQERAWSFERNILLLAGTGANRSPQARFRKLPNQPLASRALVGSWERTALTIAGAAVAKPAPEYMLLGEDGWFHQATLPPGRTAPRGAPREKWTTQDYVAAYGGMSAARGTYNVSGTSFIRKHIADTDPNLEGRDEMGQFALQGEMLTVQGADAAGQRFEAKYQRLKPFDVYAPVAPRAAAPKPKP